MEFISKVNKHPVCFVKTFSKILSTTWLTLAVLLCLVPMTLTSECPSYVCDQGKNCKLPGCQCVSASPPKGLSSQVVPQFVLFTFNGVVEKESYAPFKEVFTKGRRNPETGVRISTTIFVSDSPGSKSKVTTDYCLARRLYEDGHELASNSISHRTPSDWWKNEASVTDWTKELIGQRDNITKESSLPDSYVQGVRAPFLQPGGEKQFQAVSQAAEKDKKIKYDSSLVIKSPEGDISGQEGYWPFTLDYGTDEIKCVSGICPNNCYDALWEVPLHQLDGPKGLPCIFLDYCLLNLNGDEVADALSKIYKTRSTGNRAPLVLNFNMHWLKTKGAIEGLKKFVEELLADDETFVVNMQQLLDWMRTPVPLGQMNKIRSINNNKRDSKLCTTKRGDGSMLGFNIDGTALLVLEIGVLSLTAIVLISRDNSDN